MQGRNLDTHKREDNNMGNNGQSTSRARAAALLGNTDADVIRLCLKEWDERRSGMRESLPGDRRK